MHVPCGKADARKKASEDARQELPIVEHTWPVGRVARFLGTSAVTGLTDAEVLDARAKHGENRLPQPETLPAWLRYLLAYWDFFAMLLLFGGVLCLVAYGLDRSDPSNLYLGIVLIIVVVLSSSFAYVQESKANALMEGFKNMVPRQCRAIRGGSPRMLDAWELVPGDLVEMAAGDLVPADVRITRAQGLKVDNSPLTGESEAVELSPDWHGVTAPEPSEVEVITRELHKDVPPAVEAPNLAFFSTTVVAGHGAGIVIGTGYNTVMGQIANLATEVTAGESLISRDVNGFIRKISVVAVVIGAVFMGIGLGIGGQNWVQAIVLAISAVVATVPEGLLVTFTVSLALTARRMHSVNVLVKNTQSVETLGSTSLIASDKTGTLTQNRMTVQHCWYDGQLHIAPAYKNAREARAGLAGATTQPGGQHDSNGNGSSGTDMSRYDPAAPAFQKLQMVATLCNSSSFDASKLYLGYGKQAGDTEQHHHGLFHRLTREAPAVPAPPGSDVEAGLVAPDVQEHAVAVGPAGGGAQASGPGQGQLQAAMENASFNLLLLQCTGDASESALIKFAHPLRNIDDYRRGSPKLFEIKFNSTNKWALSIHAPEGLQPGQEGHPLLLMKGAPEQVWRRCSHIQMGGQAVPITAEHEAAFEAAYHHLGSMGERVLGFCYRSLDELPLDHPFTDEPQPNFPTSGLVFAGLMSLMDPPREGVKEAVADCHAASIKVFMVTGDHPITARAIAQQIGIIQEGALEDGRAAVITGDDIRTIQELPSEEAQLAAWDKALSHQQVVFARVTPAHKLMIVEHAQRRGEVVAVTGDGVNDAPALKKADVGLAMGIAGKDVTKEAADLLLLDDNFASIVKGVGEGRLIFDNLKKSIAYTLTSKLPELTPFLVFIIANIPLPLSTILILAIDLGTDMLPAIGLAYETREANIMARPPRSPVKHRLVDAKLLTWSYPQIGILQAAAGFIAYLLVISDMGYRPHVLPGIGRAFSAAPLLCLVEPDGSVHDCGYACGPVPSSGPVILPNTSTIDYQLLVRALRDGTTQPGGSTTTVQLDANGRADSIDCHNGCPIPGANAQDPFLEVTPQGFRGFGAGVEAACGRSCEWYDSLGPARRRELLDASRDASSPLRLVLTETDDALFQQYCRQPGNEGLGFKGRREADPKRALPGARYFWDGAPRGEANLNAQRHALAVAQSAYFVAVVLCKVVTALCAKTRLLSLFQHGLLGNRALLYGCCASLCIAALLVYVPPLNTVFGTAPLTKWYMVLGAPWALLIFVYDESRKALLRRAGRGTRFYKYMHY